jgi:hypothetical protein
MADAGTIIRSIGRAHLLARTPYEQTDETVTGFTGSE